MNGFDVVQKFIDSGYGHADYGSIYEPHESAKIHLDDNKFLLLDSHDFLFDFNTWLKENNYENELETETGYTLPLEKENAKYFEKWIDYLTNDMWGYSDDYGVCDCCSKVIQTYDSLGPIHNHWISPWGLVCETCLLESEDNIADYISELVNEPTKCNLLIPQDKLEELGYEEQDEFYENGWYGRIDDPKKIYDRIKREYPNADVIFNLTGHNPFAIEFNVYVKYNEEEEKEAV